MPGITCPPPPPPSQLREDGDLILILLEILEKIQDLGSYTLTLDDLLSDFSPSLATHTQKNLKIIVSEWNEMPEQFSWQGQRGTDNVEDVFVFTTAAT